MPMQKKPLAIPSSVVDGMMQEIFAAEEELMSTPCMLAMFDSHVMHHFSQRIKQVFLQETGFAVSTLSGAPLADDMKRLLQSIICAEAQALDSCSRKIICRQLRTLLK